MLNLILTSSRLTARHLIRPGRAVFLPASAAVSSPSSSRLLSSTPVWQAPSALTPGSGKGGKADKEKAAKEKAVAAKQRDKERAAREKARAKELKDKEKERASKIKAKEKAIREKEKDKEQKDKAKIKADKAKKAATKPLTKSLLHPPKAPQNAWQIFAAEYIAQQRADATPGEKLPSAAALAKVAAPLYRDLDPSAKAELVAKSTVQRDAYPDILAAYTASLSPAQIKEENAIRSRRRKAGLSNKRNLKIPGAPKRPLTGYMTFVGEVRRNRPEVIGGISNVLEQSKAIAAEWRALDESDRQRYNSAATDERAAYAAELVEFEKKFAESS